MTLRITDRIGSFDGSTGLWVGSSSLTVYAYPESNTVLVKDAVPAFRPVQQNITLPSVAQWGRASATTDGTGNYDLYLPQDAEQYPAGTRWFIQLPDGKTYRGVPPSVSGPLTIYDLEFTHSWVQVTGQVAASAGDGRQAAGEVTMTGQAYYDVVFAVAMTSSSYTLSVGLQTDTSVGGAPTWSFANRSQSGVRINLSQAFNGVLTWRAEVE